MISFFNEGKFVYSFHWSFEDVGLGIAVGAGALVVGGKKNIDLCNRSVRSSCYLGGALVLGGKHRLLL